MDTHIQTTNLKNNNWKGYHAEMIFIYSIQYKEKELGLVKDKREFNSNTM